ncbi:hypothetical protein OG994_21500 [Micromonospora globbae]|uniref:Uncharacterized protein n=1 Tax=Micromonospora globbae TaxID=1894969 RepID=A0ABZ1S3S2_9ACTN|nr:hypothetical protein [Micromonospora globbae]
MKPEAVLPARVPQEFLLAHTPDAAVAVTDLLAFPTGFQCTLAAVVRRERFGLAFDPTLQRELWRLREEPLPDEFLRFGVQFPDGRVATNLTQVPFPQVALPAGPVLLPDSGSGSDRRYDMGFWIWPLPPAGPVTFVCQWPIFGIPECRSTVDAQLILDAARRAVQLWPDDDGLLE